MSLSCVSDLEYYQDPYENFNQTNCNCSHPDHIWIAICECEFDYEEVSVPKDLERVVPLGIVYALVFLLGTIGNGLVIFVVRRYKRMRNVTNIFLASLSTADLLLIWFCVPIQFMKYLSHSWTMGAFLCYSVHYVQQFTRICSVLTLTTISIERYLAIAYPMKTLWLNSIGRCKKVILLIWLVAAVFAVPTGLRLDYEVVETARGRTAYWCLRGFPDSVISAAPKSELIYGLYQFLLMLVIPLATMSFCYVGIAKIVFASSTNDSLLTEQRASSSSSYTPLSPVTSPLRRKSRRKSARVTDQNRKQIVQMLLAIVVLYTVCWGPTLLDDLLVGLEVICLQTYMSQSPNLLKQIRMVFAILAYANSCVNPLVYGFMSKHFRNTFRATCCSCETDRENMRSQTTIALRMNSPDVRANVRTSLQPGGSKAIVVKTNRSVSWQKECVPNTLYQSVEPKGFFMNYVTVNASDLDNSLRS